MRKGLFFNVPAVSLCKTLDPLAHELCRSGYEIVCYNARECAPANSHGLTFKPYPAYQGGYHVDGITRQMSYFDLAEMLLDTAIALREFLRVEVATERPDFVLHSHLAPWGKAVATCYDLPAVALYGTFVLAPRIMLPFFRKRREEGSQVRGNMQQFIRCQQKYRTLYTELSGKRPKSGIWDAYVNSEPLNLAFILRAFQEQADTFGPEYRFVGHPTTAKPCSGEKRLIYQSSGSILNADAELLRSSLGVFDQLENPCLISVGRSMNMASLAPIPTNVSVAPFVDQEAVLGETAIFMTMGGMASVHEAIWAEAPMIIIPETPEQHITARKSEQLGIATYMDRQYVTEKALLGVIERMLKWNQEYRRNMRALKASGPSDTPARLARMHIDHYLDGACNAVKWSNVCSNSDADIPKSNVAQACWSPGGATL